MNNFVISDFIKSVYEILNKIDRFLPYNFFDLSKTLKSFKRTSSNQFFTSVLIMVKRIMLILIFLPKQITGEKEGFSELRGRTDAPDMEPLFSLFHYYYFLYFDSFLKRNFRFPFFFKTTCLILSFEKLSFATFRKRPKRFTFGTSYKPALKLGFMLNPEGQRSILSVLTAFYRAFTAYKARGTRKRLYSKLFIKPISQLFR